MTAPLVLVIEDNEANQLLSASLLARDGYEVATAGNAEQALGWLEDNIPDLILMDIDLPGQDGLSLTRQLKADRNTSGIRIVALTAFAMLGDSDHVIEAGCDGYISKPVDTRSFGAQVRNHLIERAS
ncbi:MAG TPA: response regulator [Candidatus Dormibacteraeota bacterium]|nr:response regulator [Candidatus Dormibacteraeota bacterium]